MIFFRAIPFSFSILWRYLIAFPVLVIMLVVFGLIAAILAFIASMLSTFVSVLIIVAFGVGATAIPVMVGLRVGLQAHYLKPKINYVQMLKPAIGYGLFEAVVILMILGVAGAVFLFFSSMTPLEMIALGEIDEDALLETLIATDPLLAWGLIAFVALATFAIRAALLVPLAGASIGVDPSGRPHTPFFGFGSGFLSVFALVLLSQLGLSFSVPIAIFGLGILGIAQDAVMQILLVADGFKGPDDLADLGREALILIGTVVFLSLFFFSLQCAGAVLVFLDKYKEVKNRQKAFDEVMREEEERAKPMQDTDLRELLRSRMPERKY
ncbi:hypothetical protein [Yoonia sp.]|uniref:hypothetical protein n=1 Tax=Yoonia sp. TaxID=2212373 RepID=UPI002FD9F0A3